MKLLIVEDNALMRKLIKSIVNDLADQIEECEDGSEALEVYAKHLHEWILMDVKMPKTDGITASREIIARYPEAQICIVTDYADQKTRQAASDAGALEYVLKDNLADIRKVIIKNYKKYENTFGLRQQT